MRHFFTLGLLCLVCTGVCGQSLLKDINSFLSPDNSPAPDVKPVAIGSTVYFVANDGINGFELWKTNGTAAGTSLVRDIFPGPDDSYPKWLVEVNGILYFSANDGLHGVELWKSDGTAQGTVMVRNIVPSSTGSNPEYLINNNGILYFAAGGEPNITYLPDRELWRSDGTAAGTVLVKNINPSYSSEPASLVSHKGEVYFSADINGSRQVWKSDGTAAGTVLLPGDVSLGTTPLVSSGDYVYFTALVPGNGTELCKTDGLTAGLVKNIHPTGNSTPSLLTDVNGTLFFVAADASGNTREVWKSDGTEAGTVMVKDIYTGTTVNAPPSSLVNVNGTLFFVAYESATGSELWKSDGTEAGTVMVKDILPSTSSNSHSQLVNVAGTLFFSGRDNSGNELWKSDGTAAGTVRIKDIYAAGTSSAPSFITPLDLSGTPGIVFFANNNTNGREPWVSDGTEAGTVMIRNIASENPSSDVKNYAFSNGIIYFSASTLNEGAELWKSDGTTAGTVLLKDLLPGASDGNPQYLTNYSGYIYFTSGGNLWRTDGTTAGTIVVKPGIGPAHLAVHNGLLYFSAAEGTSGAELWRSDGTTAGTYMLKEIRPGGTVSTRSSSPQNFNSLGNTLVFTAIDATGLRQLWKTDGTEAGTVKIVPSATISFISTEFARAGGLLYFTATSGDTGLELWRTDGTDAGTFMPKNIFPETTPGLERDAAPKYLTAFGNMVLFSAESQFGDGSPGRELWRSDGTSAGTVMVKNINPVPYAVSPAVEGGSHPSDIMVAGGIAYFYAFHPDFGRELWKTDGTDAGTVPVLDASPGIQSGIPGDFISGNNDFRPAVVNGSIYYPSGNSTTGIELYRADNSNASIVSEMIAGTGGSSPSRLFRADDVLYFYNDEGINGRELWRYAPPANYSLPAGSAEVTININEENTADTLDQLLATITQKGAQPLNHAVLVKVTKDPSVQSYNGQAYVQRHYDIEPVFNSALATAGLTLYFTQQEFDAYNIVPGTADLPSYPGDAAGKANLRIIQYHGVGTAPGNYPGTQETIDPDDNNIVWNSDAARWEVSFNVTGFSGFYITSIGSVLPVTLLSFTGRIDNGIARLEWKVAEEQDIEHYIVEKSADGISFAAFDTVAAVNAGDHTYMLYDSRPFEGNNFYRLRIKEQDGSTRFSQAVRLVKDSRDAVRIYPQPASDKLMIHTGSNRLLNTAAQLSDGSGRLISRFVLNAQPYMLDISRLATGIYYIGLGNGETVRFQKQ